MGSVSGPTILISSSTDPGQHARVPAPTPKNPALPSLILVGDSTVRNGQGDGANNQMGWGEPLADYFDPAKINICLPLGPHDMPVTEEWELVNLSAEAHNFHIHQTEFYVLPQNAPEGNAGALMDNVGLPNGGRSCDGTVATWRAARCPVQTVVVKIPFAEVGDFVYHCHIGEHQDGGMMAHIRVIASQ